jgi:hypothetical protein
MVNRRIGDEKSMSEWGEQDGLEGWNKKLPVADQERKVARQSLFRPGEPGRE